MKPSRAIARITPATGAPGSAFLPSMMVGCSCPNWFQYGMKLVSNSEENSMSSDSPPYFDLSKEFSREHQMVVTENETLISSRWLNADGTYKTGIDLETERLRVDLEDIARRLIAISKHL
jgi:hypothetical protein